MYETNERVALNNANSTDTPLLFAYPEEAAELVVLGEVLPPTALK